MPREILIGIDVGTTVLKAAAFDARSGAMLAGVERTLAVSTGPDGKREQEPAALARAVRSCVGVVRKQLGKTAGFVTGVGLAAQAGSAMIADRRTGEPHTPLALWNDTRAFAYRARVAEKAPREYWQRLTWRDSPGMGLARMLRLRETRPEVFTDRNIYVGAGEYLFFKMTGLWRQDAGNALQIGCYNAPERRLDRGPLDLVGVDLSFVAEMRCGHETQPLSKEGARFLGLPEGTPVAGPYFDHEAGYLAAAGISERPLQCSLGTAWVGNFAVPPEASWTSSFQLVVPAVVGEGWLVVQPLLTGNVTWDWGIETLLRSGGRKAKGKAARAKLYAELDGIFAESILPPEGLAALPWFNVSNPLWPDTLGGGTFFGLTPHTDRADMLRALAAGMAYEMARVHEEVKKGGLIDSVVLGGGASKGAYFRRLLAALFDPLPVLVFAEEAWAGARGCLYAFSPEVARAKASRVKPVGDRVASRIRRGYERHLELFDKLYGHVPAGGAVSFGRKNGRELL